MLTFRNELTGESISLNCIYSITETLNSSIVISGNIEELPNSYSFNGAWTTNAFGITFWIVIEDRNSSNGVNRLSFKGIDDFTYQFNNISADNELEAKTRPIDEYIDFINRESTKPGKPMLRPEGKRYILENRSKNTPNLKLEGFGNKKLSDLLRQVINRFDIEIRPHNTNPYIMLIVDRREGVFQETVRDSINLTNTEFSIDKTNLVTRQRIIGAYNDETGNYFDVTYTDDKMAAKYGILDGTPVKDDRFKNEESMIEYAKKIISESFAPSLTVDFDDMSNMYGNLTAGLGEFIRVINESIGLNVVYRVLEVTRNYDYSNQEISKKVLLGSQKYYNQRQFKYDDVVDMMVGVSDTLINESQDIRDDFANKVPYVPRRLEDGDFNITYDTKMPNSLHFKNNDDGTMNLGGIKFDENNKVIEIDDFCCKCCQGGSPSDNGMIKPEPSNVTNFKAKASYDPEDPNSWFDVKGFYIGDSVLKINPDLENFEDNPILNIVNVGNLNPRISKTNIQSNLDKRYICSNFTNIRNINGRVVANATPNINYNDFIVTTAFMNRFTLTNAISYQHSFKPQNSVNPLYKFQNGVAFGNDSVGEVFQTYHSFSGILPFNLALKYDCGFTTLAGRLVKPLLDASDKRSLDTEIRYAESILQNEKQFRKDDLYIDVSSIKKEVDPTGDRLIFNMEGLKPLVPSNFMQEYTADLYEIVYKANDGVFTSSNPSRNLNSDNERERLITYKVLREYDGVLDERNPVRLFKNDRIWVNNPLIRDNVNDYKILENTNNTYVTDYRNQWDFYYEPVGGTIDRPVNIGWSAFQDKLGFKNGYSEYFETNKDRAFSIEKIYIGEVTLINETADPYYILDPYYEHMHNINIRLEYNKDKRDDWLDQILESTPYILGDTIKDILDKNNNSTGKTVEDSSGAVYNNFDLYKYKRTTYYEYYDGADDSIVKIPETLTNVNMDRDLKVGEFRNGEEILIENKSHLYIAVDNSFFKSPLSQEALSSKYNRYAYLNNFIYDVENVFQGDNFSKLLQFMAINNPELKVKLKTGSGFVYGRTHNPYPQSTNNVYKAIHNNFTNEDNNLSLCDLQTKGVMGSKYSKDISDNLTHKNTKLGPALGGSESDTWSYTDFEDYKMNDFIQIKPNKSIIPIVYPYSFSSLGLPLDLEYQNKFKYRPIYLKETQHHNYLEPPPDGSKPVIKNLPGLKKEHKETRSTVYIQSSIIENIILALPLSYISINLKPRNETQYLIPVYFNENVLKNAMTSKFEKNVTLANDQLNAFKDDEKYFTTDKEFIGENLTNQIMSLTHFAIDSRSIRLKSDQKVQNF